LSVAFDLQCFNVGRDSERQIARELVNLDLAIYSRSKNDCRNRHMFVQSAQQNKFSLAGT